MQSRIIAYIFLLSIFIGVIAFIVLNQTSPRGMMGHGGNNQVDLWIPIIIVPVTFIVLVSAYYLIFPDISQKPTQEPLNSVESGMEKSAIAIAPEVSSLDTVLKVLREDEKKVVETIVDAGGTMLQKDITRTTGFSRVKTHRVLYRLVKRGIVTAEKHYNTYKISLADWLHQKGE